MRGIDAISIVDATDGFRLRRIGSGTPKDDIK